MRKLILFISILLLVISYAMNDASAAPGKMIIVPEDSAAGQAPLPKEGKNKSCDMDIMTGILLQ